MIEIKDGPAVGKTFSVGRAPRMLRVVQSANGTWDVLNELDDEAGDDEVIYVYEMDPETFSSYHVSRRPRSKSGWYQGGHYWHLDGFDGESVRDNDAWAAWCTEYAETIKTH